MVCTIPMLEKAWAKELTGGTTRLGAQRAGDGESGVYGTLRRRLARRAATSLTAVLFLVSGASAVEANSFVVEGTVEHQQFGFAPRHATYSFIARSEGGAWSISSQQRRQATANEAIADAVSAVGSDEGVFIAADYTTEQRKLVEKGYPVPNTSVGIVMTNTVPSCLVATELGPIWLTYLSASYLKREDDQRILAPVALNVAGGSPLPAFTMYYLNCLRTVDGETGLPKELVCIDDGFLRSILGGQLVKLQRRPPPFDKGFTNIVFHVLDYEVFSGCKLPKRSTLEVFWVSNSKLERIHRFAIEARRFEHAPAAPIPQPSIKGIASVVDGRISTTNGSVLVHYFATNRFLEQSELTRLPEFAEAVRRSLTEQPIVFPLPGSTRPRFLMLGVLLALGIIFLYVLLYKKPQTTIE